MDVRHQIELLMTVALVLYLISFFIARKHWTAHVVCACAGFALDMYATYLMFRLPGVDLWHASMVLKVHTFFSLTAIKAFFVQAGLGLAAKHHSSAESRLKYRRWHIASAKRVFLPLWVVAYASGALLFMR